jgi:hypothetical protein
MDQSSQRARQNTNRVELASNNRSYARHFSSSLRQGGIAFEFSRISAENAPIANVTSFRPSDAVGEKVRPERRTFTFVFPALAR